MRSYKDIVLKELLKHKKRSFFTLAGIILGVSILIFLGQISSIEREELLTTSKYRSGDTHMTFRNISKEKIELLRNNALVESVGVSFKEEIRALEKVGNMHTETVKEIFYADKDYFENILVKDFYSLEGKFPKDETEVVIVEKAAINKKIGDKLNIKGKEKTVVGIVEDKISKNGDKDRLILGLKNNEKAIAHIKLKSEKNIVNDIEKIGQDIGITEKIDWNGDLSSLEEKVGIKYNIERINGLGQSVKVGESTYNPDMGMIILIGIITIALIILTGISINSSIKEKRKEYAMLKCIGASNAQVRRLILKESSILALFSVVPGIILGEVVFTLIRPKVIRLMNSYNFDLPQKIDFKVILIAVAIVFIVCILASFLPMIWITKLSPIEAIKGNGGKGRKRRVRGILVRKLLGYEAELAYKNLRCDKSNLIGMTLVMLVSLVIFNVFTAYYKNQIDVMKANTGVLEKDITIMRNIDEKKMEVLDKFKEYGTYSRYGMYSPVYAIEGVPKDVISESTTYGYVDREKDIIVPDGSGMITVINDKGFETLKPYIEGKNITLEDFKKGGAILYSNREKGRLNLVKEKNKIKLHITDGEEQYNMYQIEDKVVKNPEILKNVKSEALELDLMGTMYFETILGPRTEYQMDFVGLLISESMLKDLEKVGASINKKVDFSFESELNFEFKNKMLREKYLDELEGQLKSVEKATEPWISVHNAYRAREKEREFINAFAMVMYTILGYIIIMIVLCFINIRDIVLNNRKKEFGIMFAVGMDKRMLRKCLIYEGVIQGIFALIIGNILSIEIFKIIKVNDKMFMYPKWVLILGSLIIIGVAVINTINTIKRLNSDKPVEMIRNIE